MRCGRRGPAGRSSSPEPLPDWRWICGPGAERKGTVSSGRTCRTNRGSAVIFDGGAESQRWAAARRVGAEGSADADSVADHPPRSWGLTARGATIEAGTPQFDFHLVDKVEVWSDDAARIYQQAVAAQWDPATAVPWNAPFAIADDIEDAVVQIMTYLIENEMAALIIPEPLHRADAPALQGSDAGAGGAGGR